MDRWAENEILETQVGQVPCGLKRLPDTFPGLTADETALARADVSRWRRALFVFASNGLSDRTHGFLFTFEDGEIRCTLRTWEKARDILA